MKTILLIMTLLTLQSCGTLGGNLALVKYMADEERKPASTEIKKPLRVLNRVDGTVNHAQAKIDKATCENEMIRIGAQTVENLETYYLNCMTLRGYAVVVVSQEEYDARMKTFKKEVLVSK